MRVFLSYRHEGAAHFEWVARLARDLSENDIEVIWDESLRKAVTRHCTIDPFELPLCREISRVLPLLCNVFVAVVTPGYVERIRGDGSDGPQRIPYGVVFEEWQGAWSARLNGLIKLFAAVRRGDDTLGLRYAIDFRSDDPKHYRGALSVLLDLLLDVSIDCNPYSSIDFQTWCEVFIEWCRVRFPARARPRRRLVVRHLGSKRIHRHRPRLSSHTRLERHQ